MDEHFSTLQNRQKENAPMQIVKVEVVGAQLLERLLDGVFHMFGRAVDDALTTEDEAELAGKEYLAAFCGTLEPTLDMRRCGSRVQLMYEPLAYELFVITVDVGRVPVGTTVFVDSIEQLKSQGR